MEADNLNKKLEKYGMRLEFWRLSDLQELVKKTKNPKKHYNKDIDALSKSIQDLGFKSVVYIDKDATEIGAGVGRILAAARQGIEELPVIRILDLNKTKFKKFRISDNRLNQLSNKWDEDILMADLAEITSFGDDIGWMDFPKFDRILSREDAVELADRSSFEVDTSDPLSVIRPEELGGRPVTNADLRPRQAREAEKTGLEPDDFAVDFSSANEWGIPDLDPRFQATALPLPFVKWGEISYKKPLNSSAGEGGCWCFYVEDDKFESISDNPAKPLRAMPSALVELNYSTYETQPAALAIGHVFFKRWVARYWQSKGFNVIVDLNVVPKFSKINLIGVPEGWRAYATRGSGERSWVENDYKIALEHSGVDPRDLLFIIYGGGQAIQDFAREHHCHWIPERLQVVSNQSLAGADGLDVRVSPDKYADIK